VSVLGHFLGRVHVFAYSLCSINSQMMFAESLDFDMIADRSELVEDLVGHDLLVIVAGLVLDHVVVVVGDFASCSSCSWDGFVVRDTFGHVLVIEMIEGVRCFPRPFELALTFVTEGLVDAVSEPVLHNPSNLRLALLFVHIAESNRLPLPSF